MGKSIGMNREPATDPTALGRTFKQRLRNGDILLGGMIMDIVRVPIVKLYRNAGFDFIYMDNEHVHMAGLPHMADFVLAARDNQMPIIAKVPELTRIEAGRLLEAGVYGIQLPRTETREQIRTLYDYMQFPPVGSRAGAPIYGNVDYSWPTDSRQWIENANESMLLVAHIETRAAYENIDEIVSTPGVDMVYVGPYDFSISMGQPGDYDHPDVAQGLQRVLDACLEHKVPFGTTASGPEAAVRWIDRGAQFFEVVDELSLIARGAAETVDAYRKAVESA